MAGHVNCDVSSDDANNAHSLSETEQDVSVASQIAAPETSSQFRLAGDERWYVVYTKSHCEIGSQRQLHQQGFCSFLPRYRKTIRHARRLTNVNAAFFPRYLFVALDLNRDAWRSVNGTFGVVSLIMDEMRPRPVPHGIVETMVESSDADGFVQPHELLRVGDCVRVLNGPFANLVGELVRLDGNRRVQVLLEAMGTAIRASMDRNGLMSVRAG